MKKARLPIRIKSANSALLFLISVSSIFISTNVSAYSLIRPYISLGGGGSFTSNLGFSQNFYIQDPSTDEFFFYKSNKQTQITSFYDAVVGGEWYINQNLLLQTGLEYNQITGISSSGNVTQGADVQSQDIFSYTYSLVTRQALLQAKLLGVVGSIYHPYILGGIGVAYNNAYGYSTSAPSFLTFTRMYQSKTVSSFSFALGIGADMDLSPNLRFGIGYRFSDIGKVQLGSATIDTKSVSGTLSQSNVYTNQIFAQLSYVY